MMGVIIPTTTAGKGPSRALEGAPVAVERSLVVRVGVGGAGL